MSEITSIDEAIGVADTLAAALNGPTVACCWKPEACGKHRKAWARYSAVSAFRLNGLCTPCRAHAHACEAQCLLYLVRKHQVDEATP